MPRHLEDARVRGLWERNPGSGVWWIRYRDADGRLRRKKIGRKRAAEDALNAARNKRQEGTALPVNLRNKGVKFKDLAEAIIEYTASQHRDQRNILSRLKRIRRDFDERPAESIKPEDINHWLTKNTSTPATSNRYRALFSLIFREALNNRKVKSNPARLVRQKQEPDGVIRWLSEHEERALRKAIAENHPLRMPEFEIALGTGMRLSEQYSMNWGQVDLERNEVRLPKTKNYSGRSVPINSVVKAAFEVLKARAPRAKKNDPIFLGLPRRWWKEALKTASVDHFRWHDCRHTFCSRLAMKGINIKVIQTLAGHKTIAMTARYAHLDDHALRAAVDSLVSK